MAAELHGCPICEKPKPVESHMFVLDSPEAQYISFRVTADRKLDSRPIAGAPPRFSRARPQLNARQ